MHDGDDGLCRPFRKSDMPFGSWTFSLGKDPAGRGDEDPLGPGEHAPGSPLIMERGDLLDARCMLGPVLEFRLAEEYMLRLGDGGIGQVILAPQLAHGSADRESKVVWPFVEGIDG